MEPEEIEQEDADLNTENSLISSGEMVLKQTARANINNPNNGIKENVRLPLDSGSQRTYATESLAKRMNLKLVKKEEIMLVTFGSDTPKRIKTPTTKLNIQRKDGSTLKISANVVPQIAGSIQRRPVNLKSVKTGNMYGQSPHLLMTSPMFERHFSRPLDRQRLLSRYHSTTED